MTVTVGSLFTGVGGFDLGFKRAGFRVVWQVEIDPHAQAVLRRHWPEVALFDDVREVGAHNLTPVDVITFGSPCTDLSVAGKRAGLAGAQSGLFFEATRIIRELRPTWVVWENVPGALSSHGGRDFGAALDALADSGCVALGWRVLDARYFGVAQRRRRVFVVGCTGDGGDPEQVLFEREGVRGDSQASAAAGQGTTGALTARAGSCGADDNDAQGGRLIVGGLVGRYAKGTDSDATDALVLYKKRGGFGFSEAEDCAPTLEAEAGSHQGGPERVPLLAQTLQASVGHHGHSSPRGDGSDNLVVAETVRSHPRPGSNSLGAIAFAWQAGGGGPSEPGRSRQWVTRAGDYTGALGATRVDAVAVALRGREGGSTAEVGGEVSNAVRAGQGSASRGGHVMTTQVRRLTPRECERLQGFPDDWTRWRDDGVELPDTHRYRCMGNAVCVPVATWLARRLAAQT